MHIDEQAKERPAELAQLRTLEAELDAAKKAVVHYRKELHSEREESIRLMTQLRDEIAELKSGEGGADKFFSLDIGAVLLWLEFMKQDMACLWRSVMLSRPKAPLSTLQAASAASGIGGPQWPAIHLSRTIRPIPPFRLVVSVPQRPRQQLSQKTRSRVAQRPMTHFRKRTRTLVTVPHHISGKSPNLVPVAQPTELHFSSRMPSQPLPTLWLNMEICTLIKRCDAAGALGVGWK